MAFWNCSEERKRKWNMHFCRWPSSILCGLLSQCACLDVYVFMFTCVCTCMCVWVYLCVIASLCNCSKSMCWSEINATFNMHAGHTRWCAFSRWASSRNWCWKLSNGFAIGLLLWFYTDAFEMRLWTSDNVVVNADHNDNDADEPTVPTMTTSSIDQRQHSHTHW